MSAKLSSKSDSSLNLDDILDMEAEPYISAGSSHNSGVLVPSINYLQSYYNAELASTFMNGTLVTPPTVANQFSSMSSILNSPPVTPCPDLSLSRRNPRKDNHAPRQASPAFIRSPWNNNEVDDGVEEPEVTPPQPPPRVRGRPRKNPCIESHTKVGRVKKEVKNEQKVTKQKMYEMDGPGTKGAKLAKENREKKKLDREKTMEENEELLAKIKDLEAQVAAYQRNIAALEAQRDTLAQDNRAKEGLQKVYPDIQRLLKTSMPELMAQSPGPWELKFPPWFSTVNIPQQPDYVPERPFTPPTSTYISLRISTAERKVFVDYDPDYVQELAEFSNN